MFTVKKGRHRRYEEARALKRSHDGDFEALLDDFVDEPDDLKPEHEAWAAEFGASDVSEDELTDADSSADEAE